MLRHASFIAVATIASLAACGDDPSPLLGVWQVTSHTMNPSACDVEGAAVADPPYIKFIESEFFGQTFVERVDCTSATTCDESASLFGETYSESIADGLRGSVYASSGDSTRCILSGSRWEARLVDGAVRIEKRHYVSGDLVGVTCDPDTTEAMFDTLPCVELEVMTGTRVE